MQQPLWESRWERAKANRSFTLKRERSSRRMITAECNASEGEAAQRRKGCLLLLSLSLIEEKKVACLPLSVSHWLSSYQVSQSFYLCSKARYINCQLDAKANVFYMHTHTHIHPQTHIYTQLLLGWMHCQVQVNQLLMYSHTYAHAHMYLHVCTYIDAQRQRHVRVLWWVKVSSPLGVNCSTQIG